MFCSNTYHIPLFDEGSKYSDLSHELNMKLLCQICVGYMLTVNTVVKNYLKGDRKLYTAFMYLEKVYDRVDRKAQFDVCRIYGVGDICLRGLRCSMRKSVCLYEWTDITLVLGLT